MNNKPKILISAYACSPDYGSEPGMGWNWVSRISDRYETWVLTDEYYASSCLEYIERNGLHKPKLHLVGIKRPGGRHRLYGFFYLHYLTQNLWQRKAFKVAKKLHAQFHFDLVHQLNMIGYREPGYLSFLDKNVPYVWGPVGGYVQMPCRFLSFLGVKDCVVYGLRNMLNAIQARGLKRVRKAMLRADAIFAATGEDYRSIKIIHNRSATLVSETGTDVCMKSVPDGKYADFTRPLALVWIGVFRGQKALPLALYALARARAKKSSLRVNLTIFGKGPCDQQWRTLANKLGVADLCSWPGWVPHDLIPAHLEAADAMLFTSLQDASSTVVPEALMHGVPVICHDACGFGSMVTERCGIKVPLTDPETSIQGFTDAILCLESNRGMLAALAQGALERAVEISWQNNVNVVLNKYRQLLNGGESVGLENGPLRG